MPQYTLEEEKQEKKRKTANVFEQTYLCTTRALLRQIRDWRGFLVDNFFVFLAGAILGLVFFAAAFIPPISEDLQAQCPVFLKSICALPRKDSWGPVALLTFFSFSLSTVSAGLNVYGKQNDKVVFIRESGSGLSKFAYYFGKLLAETPRLLLSPIVFLSAWYSFISPQQNVLLSYLLLLVVAWTFSGAAYTLSLLVKPDSAQLAGVVMCAIFVMFSGTVPSLTELTSSPLTFLMAYISPARWGVEALYVLEMRALQDMGYSVDTALETFGYSMDYWWVNWLVLLVVGFVTRVLAFVVLYFSDPAIKARLRFLFSPKRLPSPSQITSALENANNIFRSESSAPEVVPPMHYRPKAGSVVRDVESQEHAGDEDPENDNEPSSAEQQKQPQEQPQEQPLQQEMHQTAYTEISLAAQSSDSLLSSKSSSPQSETQTPSPPQPSVTAAPNSFISDDHHL